MTELSFTEKAKSLFKLNGMEDLFKSDPQGFQNVVEFLDDVRRQVGRAGGRVFLSPKRSIQFAGEDIKVNGYWDEESMTLAAACGQPFNEWLSLLAHEFSHFRQFIERREPYTATYEKDKDGATVEDRFFGWLDGKRTLSKREVKRLAAICRDMELDCERVTLRVIREYRLPLDPAVHAERSAAYIHFYNVLPEVGHWYCIGHEPYNNPRVLELMPAALDGDFSKTPRKIRNVIIEECL